MLLRIIFKIIILFFTAGFLSCSSRTVVFQVTGTDTKLEGLSKNAVLGIMDETGSNKLEYRFISPPVFAENTSIEIEYSFVNDDALMGNSIDFILAIGGNSYKMPRSNENIIFHYSVPITKNSVHDFSVSLMPLSDEIKIYPSLQIHSINFTESLFGYKRIPDEKNSRVYMSSFITYNEHETSGDAVFEIDLHEIMAASKKQFPALRSELRSGKNASVNTERYIFEASPYLNQFNIPYPMILPKDKKIFLSGDRFTSFCIDFNSRLPFPSPISADPGLVLSWPLSGWRDSRFEVFRWDNFPSLLIFDFRDYAMQDKMLKRLAFFVEKAGFKGRLAPDSEIAHLNGWNAHDYKAQDLARFFNTTLLQNFPLLNEELELMQILINEGIIAKNANGEIQAGEGGIISVSRESEGYLRSRFMAHEGFHGLYFIDEDFRNFCRSRWQQLGAEAKKFIASYFQYYQLDIGDGTGRDPDGDYLLYNELMAYILQLPVLEAGFYFGSTLPSRLENNPRRKDDLPFKDARTNTWPILASAFDREARAFSDYVEKRWGLSGGRVNNVSVKVN